MIYQGSKKYPVNEVILHASATKPEWMAGQPIEAKVAEIKRWHTSPPRNWNDIGYHWVIDRDGHVLAGRDEDVPGAHVRGRNSGTIGICLLGGFGGSADDRFEDHFTPEQRAATWHLIRSIANRTELLKVTGHNRYAAKACPCFEVPLEFPWPPAERPLSLWGQLKEWLPW